MINGAHAIIYSTDADADRDFFRDVLGLPSVDAGQGWLIFGLPPSEVAVHPANANGTHELYLLVESVDAFVAEMRRRKIKCGPKRTMDWGGLVEVTLPGGGAISVYEPRHPRPTAAAAKRTRRSTARPGATTTRKSR